MLNNLFHLEKSMKWQKKFTAVPAFNGPSDEGTPGERGQRTGYFGFLSLLRQTVIIIFVISSRNILFQKWRRTNSVVCSGKNNVLSRIRI